MNIEDHSYYPTEVCGEIVKILLMGGGVFSYYPVYLLIRKRSLLHEFKKTIAITN